MKGWAAQIAGLPNAGARLPWILRMSVRGGQGGAVGGGTGSDNSEAAFPCRTGVSDGSVLSSSSLLI